MNAVRDPERLFLGVTAGDPAPDAMWMAVSRFYAREACLLDDERYEDWLQLFTPAARYWMPTIENRFRRDDVGSFQAGRMSFFDDDLETLKLRIRRLDSGVAWPEDPPTRHVYLVSNVEAYVTEDPNGFVAHSSFLAYRNKLDRDQSTLVGRRRDRLVATPEGLRIDRRLILLSQSLLLTKNLNIFF